MMNMTVILLTLELVFSRLFTSQLICQFIKSNFNVPRTPVADFVQFGTEFSKYISERFSMLLILFESSNIN